MDGGHTHIAMAMEQWKQHPNPGPECLMPSFLTDQFPPDPLAEDGSGNEAGFEKHGLSVAVGSPQDEGKPAQLTPHFGGRMSGSSSSLSERMQARNGFSVPKLSMPFATPAGDDSEQSGVQPPIFTVPPGLSPASLLESPVFLSNAMGQASPTTGKLFMLGDADDNNPTRIEAPSIEDGPAAFSFKSLDLKSSRYIAEEMKETLPSNQHPSLPSRDVPVKTETNIQATQGANPLGNKVYFNGQELMKSSYHDSNKRNRLAPDTIVGRDSGSPPDHSQPAADSEANPATMATAATATPAEDGYSWRKYGQKQVKHSEYPRSYYKCTHQSCQVKKKVERSHEGHVTEIIYKGTHNHPKPAAQGRRLPGVPQVHPFGDMDIAADNNNNNDNNGNAGGATQQPNAEARPLWHGGGGMGVQDWRGGDGLEATSSPGELCDSSASMQVHDGTATRFGSPEGVDVTSAVSDEVDGDDRVRAHGSMSQGHNQGAADAGEGDELESKRRKLESCAIEMSTASRAVREPRVVIQTTSEVDILDDGYRWRKYGQKVVKGNPNPRSYYKCTHPGCSVRKHVERASHDLKSVITTYEGKHNHEVPAARNGGGHATSGSAAAQLAHARRPEPPSMAQDGLMMGRLGAPFGLPPRDPLGPMSNFPYSLGVGGYASSGSLPSLPMPAAVEGLKLPMLSPCSLHPLFRHRQAMDQTAAGSGFRVPKGEVKDESNNNSSASAYQQMMNRLPLGHRM
ncbi:probable WRKY transcription factor 20 isoform X2 [Brachypodium distachyon]|nr:probable WRKY transcription factor 20 isoform X2 [Brachypodium distachyon]KQJ83108.1 hypothetical protein BRADI_5g13090v3 [Brachypodium distachyon]|eukprot:XP_003579949.1 probable WRKY transcription factor 20 isoform X2 [Brachypodium distachyon]